jgi:hypothetical protein
LLKTAGGYAGTTTDQPRGLMTNNLERVRITRNGLVGIGTTAPTVQLEVNSTSTNYGALTANGGNALAGTSSDGSTGITASGGTGDLTVDAQGNGGDGLVASGGASTSVSGTGVVANGAYGQMTGEGGPGIVASGGGGEVDAGEFSREVIFSPMETGSMHLPAVAWQDIFPGT